MTVAPLARAASELYDALVEERGDPLHIDAVRRLMESPTLLTRLAALCHSRPE